MVGFVVSRSIVSWSNLGILAPSGYAARVGHLETQDGREKIEESDERRRRVGRQVGGGLFERGMSDEWRVCRDIFVRQSPTESDESDELGHPPRVTYVGRVGLCRGRQVATDESRPRDESNTNASARGGQESRSRRRHVEPQPKRGSLLSHSVGATHRLVATTLQSKSDRI